uniref:RNA helicase n=1 Tax=Oncorhynchus kisutch TaxID=8019 RepID=A0A8C7C7E2_ONCKI
IDLSVHKVSPSHDSNGALENQVKANNHSLFVIERAAQSLLNKLIRSNLVNTTNQVEVHQRDPNSQLYSVKLRLKPQLLQGVYAMGFNRPSKIQENALPLMLAEL